MAEHEKEDAAEGCFVVSAFWALLFVGFLKIVWPSLIPFNMFDLWVEKETYADALLTAPPFIGAYLFVNLVFDFTVNEDSIDKKAHELCSSNLGASTGMILAIGGVKAAWAGIAEEICFRWLLFFGAIVSIKWADFILGGFIGLHIVKWFYVNWLCPLANFLSLGYLSSILYSKASWAVGAAVVVSNGKFRDGHEYLGTAGWIMSWFFGMYMHWIVFNYGLRAAILIHFLNNFLIYCLTALIIGIRILRIRHWK